MHIYSLKRLKQFANLLVRPICTIIRKDSIDKKAKRYIERRWHLFFYRPRCDQELKKRARLIWQAQEHCWKISADLSKDGYFVNESEVADCRNSSSSKYDQKNTSATCPASSCSTWQFTSSSRLHQRLFILPSPPLVYYTAYQSKLHTLCRSEATRRDATCLAITVNTA